MRLLRLTEVMHKTGLSRSFIYNLIQQGEFPKPIKIGNRLSAWPEETIHEWIASKQEGH